MISCYLIDDDQRSLQILEEYIEPMGYLQVVFASQNPNDLIPQIAGFPEECIVFMDIDMPEINGLDLAELLPRGTALIFTTGHAEYAYKAFDLDATDYLIKPFDQKRFLKSILKVTKIFHIPQIPKQNDEFIYLKLNKNLKKIFYEDILYVESMENYIHVHTTDQKITIHQSLKSILAQLPEHHFMRINRFHIVNLKKIAGVGHTSIELDQAIKLKLSPVYKTKFLNLFHQQSARYL